jgi:predicted metal-dependent hydrolase
MTSAILFGSKRIEFRLAYSNRKSLGITVTPELNVLVKAPFQTPIDKVKEKLRKKAPWILKQQNFFLSYLPKTPPKRYLNGETHLYLGRQYRIKYLKSHEVSVKLKGRYIEVRSLGKSQIKQLVQAWYARLAKDYFHNIAFPLIQKFYKYQVRPSSIVLRDMPTRWGSCTTRSKIILNPSLIKAPRGCIEYVIIHELCHLVHRGHTRKFYELQSKVMPHWQKWKNRLETIMISN